MSENNYFIHYGSDRFEPSFFTPIRNCSGPIPKPEGGLWASRDCIIHDDGLTPANKNHTEHVPFCPHLVAHRPVLTVKNSDKQPFSGCDGMPHAFEGNRHPPSVVANGSFLWAESVFLPTAGGTSNSFPFLKKERAERAAS